MSARRLALAAQLRAKALSNLHPVGAFGIRRCAITRRYIAAGATCEHPTHAERKPDA